MLSGKGGGVKVGGAAFGVLPVLMLEILAITRDLLVSQSLGEPIGLLCPAAGSSHAPDRKAAFESDTYVIWMRYKDDSGQNYFITLTQPMNHKRRACL
jgi:hypothetical protein